MELGEERVGITDEIVHQRTQIPWFFEEEGAPTVTDTLSELRLIKRQSSPTAAACGVVRFVFSVGADAVDLCLC